MKYIHYILTVLIIICICIIAFFLIQDWFYSRLDTMAVVKEIRALNKWETSSYTIEKVIDSGTGGNVFQQFLFGNRILLIAHGEVIGGFDFSSFSTNNIEIQGKSITVTLPAPEILVTTIDNTKTRVYDKQQGLLVPTNNNLEIDALATAQSAIRSDACSEGILSTSSSNAKKQLISLLRSLQFNTIIINIPSGSC